MLGAKFRPAVVAILAFGTVFLTLVRTLILTLILTLIWPVEALRPILALPVVLAVVLALRTIAIAALPLLMLLRALRTVVAAHAVVRPHRLLLTLCFLGKARLLRLADIVRRHVVVLIVAVGTIEARTRIAGVDRGIGQPLLLAIDQDDATVVLGVLQEILRQNRVA